MRGTPHRSGRSNGIGDFVALDRAALLDRDRIEYGPSLPAIVCHFLDFLSPAVRANGPESLSLPLDRIESPSILPESPRRATAAMHGQVAADDDLVLSLLHAVLRNGRPEASSSPLLRQIWSRRMWSSSVESRTA